MNVVLSYLPLILRGALVTLQMATIALVGSCLLGLLCALAKLGGPTSLRLAATAYTTTVRGVPDLVLMLLVVFGGQLALNEVADRLHQPPVLLEPFAAGCVTLCFIFGAYFAETFRGALLAVPRGQREAALAVGMTRSQTFVRVVGPQMIRHALPGLGNNWLVLLKGTAIVSVIGLEDVNLLAGQAGRNTGRPFDFYLLVCAIYLALTALSSLLLAWLGARASAGVRRTVN